MTTTPGRALILFLMLGALPLRAEETIPLFAVLLTTGPKWVAGKPPGEQPAFREHGRNMQRLRDRGDIVIGARYSDTGLLVVRGASADAVRAEMNADPGVVAGTFTFALHELRPFYGGCVEAARPDLQVVVGPWRLQSNPWVNLHQRLMHAARFGSGAPEALTDAQEVEWRAAVDAYRTVVGNRSAVFDERLIAINDALATAWGDTIPQGLDPEAAKVLTQAMAIYRPAAWPADDRANRFWIASARPLLESAGEELLQAHGKVYETPMPPRILVDVAAQGWQFGAYTVGDASAVHSVIASSDPGYRAYAALEILLHEPSHGIVDTNRGTIGGEIGAAAKELGVRPQHGLWHALLFHTSGELTRRALAARGVTDYVPFVGGMWDRQFRGLQKAVETHWNASPDGRLSRADAVRAIVRETATQSQ